MQLSRGIKQGEETLRIKKNNLLLVKKPCVSSRKKNESTNQKTDEVTSYYRHANMSKKKAKR